MDGRVESLVRYMVRVGVVMSVDNDKLRARVRFPDLDFTSAWLPVVYNQPFIPDYDAKPQRTEFEAGGSGDAAFERHKHDLVIKPWMPKVNETVLCLYIPEHNGTGFVLGGIKA